MTLAVITSGGDSPGMNACIRAVVRHALSCGATVWGFHRGYQGILEDDAVELTRASVSNIIQQGGTFLQTDRCADFIYREPRLRAGEILRSHGVEGLIVIGGDGSFRGAADLYDDTGIPVVGIPGTIDNDLAYTDYSIGFDTAVNNVLWAINSLRDTMHSHNKVTVVEVMGRRCGDIALHAGIAGGAEYILVPEVPYDMEAICQGLRQSAERGKKSNLILLAEGAGKLEPFCEELEKRSGISPRQTRLGFIQRGGSPTYRDRLLACRLGIYAVDLLMSGTADRVVGIRQERIIDCDLREAVSMTKVFDEALYRSATTLI